MEQLVTQPYDKISPAMQARYLGQSPYNLVRIILGERFASDDDRNNVYTRAAAHLEEWIAKGILAQDPAPAFYAYFQTFQLPGADGPLVRKGFIGLGPVEDYAAGIVHRHEQTLSGPKKDRMELLNHTHAHFGQIVHAVSRPGIDCGCNSGAACGRAAATVTDEYGTLHRLWRMRKRGQVAAATGHGGEEVTDRGRSPSL